MSRLASAYDIMQTNSSPVPVSLKPPPKPWLTPWPPSVIRSPVRSRSPNLRTISTRPCGFRSSFQPSRRDHCGGSDPPRGGGKWCPDPCPPLPSPVPHQRPKRGGRSLHFLPLSCGATTRRARRGQREAAPHYALPQRIRGIRANPLPMRIPGHSLDHNGEGFAL